MSTKTKTTTVAALAALVLPTAALAHDGEQKGQRSGERDRQEQRSERGDRGHDRKGHKRFGGRGFLVAGVDAANLSVSPEGKLAGPLTVDPVAASRSARKLLELTREELRGEGTVTFGVAGDDVKLRYRGLTATDALTATDVVSVVGKINRKTGALDIKKIQITRRAAPAPAAPTA
jgi:hypothetical protein